MSEIKGQLLGIILVLMVFGIVAASLTAIFNGLSSTVANEVSNAVSQYGIWYQKSNNGLKCRFLCWSIFYAVIK